MRKKVCMMATSLFEDALMMQGDVSGGDSSVLTQTVGDESSSNFRVLNFAFLGCEPAWPYGPIPHTAQLLLESLAQAAKEVMERRQSCQRREQENKDDMTNDHDSSYCWMLRMKLYNVQKEEYPVSKEEWDKYDGIILPGSFSAAYEEAPWIHKLCDVIQKEIVAPQRKTLGICFGHQVLAHSFADGLASKMPEGSRAGRIVMTTTAAGQGLLGKGQQHYYYTHGDHVERLPSTAVCLGGDDRVPILSAAYFGTPEEAKTSSTGKPYAVTFQAHPEYASSKDMGLFRTLNAIIDVMVQKGLLESKKSQVIGQDAVQHYDVVQRDSLDTIVTVGQILGWFPQDETGSP
jgi:GMP synthase-like glutamine amidotransferase